MKFLLEMYLIKEYNNSIPNLYKNDKGRMVMKILVINAGSSSLKYQLIDMDGEKLLAKGLCARVGGTGGSCKHEYMVEHPVDENDKYREYSYKVEMKDHTAAFAEVKKCLTTGEGKVIDDFSEIDAVGHRIVQGGAIFDKSVLVDEKVIADIESLIPLAPLHNAAHVQGIRAAIETCGKNVPQVVVFDTSFHATMPKKAFLWGLPYEMYEKYAVRRYGFHGTSHRFVSKRCAELIGKPDAQDTKIITCHIGNGSSLAAVKDGKVIDTTMGLTPLDGFMMGSRSGAVDPSAVTYIMDKEKLSPAQMDELLNKKSGMLGIAGVSDDRDVTKLIEEGNEMAKLAWDMRNYQIVKSIGAFVAALDGVDAMVFTAGIGENQIKLREDIMNALGYLGITLNEENNATRGTEIEISGADSKVRVFVIPTNEELVIARDTKAIVEAL